MNKFLLLVLILILLGCSHMPIRISNCEKNCLYHIRERYLSLPTEFLVYCDDGKTRNWDEAICWSECQVRQR